MSKWKDKTYLYLSSAHSVCYDKLGWYIDDAQQDPHGSTNFEASAKKAANSFIVQDIKKYSSAFKHLAVLSGAGTSMDNGNMPGKKRTELWDSCKDEITCIQKVISSKGKTMKKTLTTLSKIRILKIFFHTPCYMRN